jgi:DNA-binding SARP family transcriptional activator/tetratricopeptide (TPR) repeat protein
MVRLRLLGALTAEVGGQPLAMPSSERARALIGWLAVHRGNHPRAAVAARLWPDVPAASGRANLRTALWAIRRAWGPAADAVAASRLGIGLRAGVWVDVYDGDLAGDDGELLRGIDDDWADEARAAHRTRRRHALAEAADEADRDGRAADAVRLTRARCRLDPLDEHAHRALLDMLARAGDRAGAVVAARDFADRLRADLGVRPSPATRAAHARLRTGAPAAAPVRPALFGRGPRLRELTGLWKAAADGAGQVVVLTGEAGIGKTSLLAELTHRAGLGGGRTAVGAGVGVAGETPFAVWLELARALVATVAPVPAAAGWPVELNRLSPQLGALLGRPDGPPAVTAPELERLRVFEAVLRLVEWSCADRPALIALDDAHRADRASLRLTAHVGRRLARLPVLLVLTRRDRPARPELDAVLADLAGRSVPITEITLGPITDAEVAALASSLLAASLPATDDAQIRQVVAAAEGNPLLAVESARVLATGGSGPPPNLRTAVRATAGLLPAPAQTLIGLLAAAGRPLSSAELDGLAMPGLAEAEQAACADGLLVRRSGRLGFRHDLLREAVYADLPDVAPLHDRIAAALDRGDRAEVARHLMLAGRDDRAAHEWAAAAAYARSVGALTEAEDFLNRAVRLAPADGRLWLELAEICAWRGRRPEMDAAWERSLALLEGEDIVRAWCRRGRQLRSVVCHPEASLRAYQTARAELTGDHSPAVHAETLVGLAWGEAVAGDPAAADTLLTAAEARLTCEAPAQMRADIAEIRMQGLIRQGRFRDSARIALDQESSIADRQLPDRTYAFWINAACALAFAGDYDGALAMADRSVAATEQVPVLLVGSLAARAHLLARLGRHEEAAAAIHRERACAERLDSPGLAATAAHDAGLVALAAGDHPAAAELLGDALEAGATVSRPAAGLARAEALALSGDPDAAAAQLRVAMLEPVGRADQPWALVPRVAWVQGLIARARGDEPLATRRFAESANGWRSMLATAPGTAAEDYTAAMLDLGRPPVVGLVEPGRELARVEKEMTCPR